MMAISKADPLAAEIRALETLNIEELRQAWRNRFGAPPPLRSGDMMRRCLAEKLQIAALGRDVELDRELDRLVRSHARGVSLRRQPARIVEGAVLIREYEGRTYRVETRNDGFAWNGRTWRSLSEIAREITGVRWNGPRFFGLRPAKAA